MKKKLCKQTVKRGGAGYSQPQAPGGLTTCSILPMETIPFNDKSI